MDIVRYLPFVSTVVVLAFAAVVLRRFSLKGGMHLLLWGVGLTMYGLGTLAEAYLALAFAPFMLHTWYLFGAILNPAWLGQGTVFLLVRRKNVANILLIVLVLASILTALHVFSLRTDLAPYNVGTTVSAQYKDVMERTSLTTALLAVFAFYGTLALVGGALYSAYIFWRKRIMPQRVLGNVLIAAGALSPAIGGALAKSGGADVLFLSELLGAIIMFIGFRLATTQQPVPVSAPQTAASS
jgi:hypothetical protein